MRSRVHELLIAEEDKLAAAHADSALLADIEQHISDGDRRIEQQRVRVASMHSNGHGGLALAQSLLDGMIASNELHKQYRAHLLAKIRENPLSC
jgi:hypothetical protein